jgi:hypothetical protein
MDAQQKTPPKLAASNMVRSRKPLHRKDAKDAKGYKPKAFSGLNSKSFPVFFALSLRNAYFWLRLCGSRKFLAF